MTYQLGSILQGLNQWKVMWFTPDGHEIWCDGFEGISRWAIINDSESNVTKLECLDPTGGPSGGYLWQSSYGSQVTDDGRVLSASRKLLLWLPHYWGPHKRRDIMWNGEFLALLYPELPEVVILELPE